jgi:hypothetical protein
LASEVLRVHNHEDHNRRSILIVVDFTALGNGCDQALRSPGLVSAARFGDCLDQSSVKCLQTGASEPAETLSTIIAVYFCGQPTTEWASPDEALSSLEAERFCKSKRGLARKRNA